MMEVVRMEELKNGDVIIIEGMEADELLIVTVKKSINGLIIPVELGGLDYCPNDPDRITRLCKSGERAAISILSNKIGFK